MYQEHTIEFRPDYLLSQCKNLQQLQGMQTSVSETFYIKVQYKHIIKKLRVPSLQKPTLDSILTQFTQHFNGQKGFLHLENPDKTYTPILSNHQLQEVFLAHPGGKIIKLYLFKTACQNGEVGVFEKKKYQSKSESISVERLTSSWDLYESMIILDSTKLRKISEDLVESRRELRVIKEQKRHTNLSELLSFI